MENKYVGMLIAGVAVVMLIIVISYNMALESIVTASCTHGEACPMHTTVAVQEIISYSLIGLLILGGIVVTFFIKEKKLLTTTKPVEKTDFSNIDFSKLDEDETKIVNVLKLGKGSSYQSDLIKETGLTKVKITRLLDKLEGKKIIERKRRGMTNIVILK